MSCRGEEIVLFIAKLYNIILIMERINPPATLKHFTLIPQPIERLPQSSRNNNSD